jgi:hypothetical protein
MDMNTVMSMGMDTMMDMNTGLNIWAWTWPTGMGMDINMDVDMDMDTMIVEVWSLTFKNNKPLTLKAFNKLLKVLKYQKAETVNF